MGPRAGCMFLVSKLHLPHVATVSIVTVSISIASSLALWHD